MRFCRPSCTGYDNGLSYRAKRYAVRSVPFAVPVLSSHHFLLYGDVAHGFSGRGPVPVYTKSRLRVAPSQVRK